MGYVCDLYLVVLLVVSSLAWLFVGLGIVVLWWLCLYGCCACFGIVFVLRWLVCCGVGCFCLR